MAKTVKVSSYMRSAPTRKGRKKADKPDTRFGVEYPKPYPKSWKKAATKPAATKPAATKKGKKKAKKADDRQGRLF